MIKATEAKAFTKMATEGYHTNVELDIFLFLSNIIDTKIHMRCLEGKNSVSINKAEIIKRYPYLTEVTSDEWQEYFHFLTTEYANIGYEVSYEHSTKRGKDNRLIVNNMQISLKW